MRCKKVLMLLGAYDPQQHLGIARAARTFGWHLDISPLKTFRLPSRWTGDGIICSLNSDNRLADFVRASGVPAVDLSVWRAEISIPRVAADNQAIGALAAEHFLGFGHRHFAWFALGRNPVGQIRLQGFRERLAEHSFGVVNLTRKQAEDPVIIAKKLQDHPRPMAVFTMSDLDGAWLLNVCLQAELNVPEDIAILGVDNNTLICESQPVALSSINHDLERIGFQGARLLDALMDGQQVVSPPLISPNGVTTRKSTNALAVSDPLVKKALRVIQARLDKSFGVNEVADVLGISRRQLEMRFHEALGMGVHQKCIEMRLKKVETLLLNSTESVEAITALTGFANAPHLSRVFKQRYGMPPLRYRKAHTVAQGRVGL